jgi:hypothetical protein
MKGPHALRLYPDVQLALMELRKAGPAGLALRLANHSAMLEQWGLAEYFEDESRVLYYRIRITASGEKVAATLLDPTPKGDDDARRGTAGDAA